METSMVVFPYLFYTIISEERNSILLYKTLKTDIYMVQ